ncbi:thiamine-phosphate kinase [Candidatus Fermentibacteria bacterium]|nr:thiamine-phosphate kinase [Candidatus Fermentibacteria bacterium]
MEDLTVSDMGERALLRRLRKTFPRLSLAGDDAAELPAELRRPVVTTDSFLEGSHFFLWWTSPRMLGRRLVEATLSDVAAMGAEPRWSLVSLILPSQTRVGWLEDLYRGFQHRSEPVLAGGETVSGDRLGVTLTVIAEGEGENENPLLRRSGLSEGDRLWVTGRVGRALGAPGLIESAGGLFGDELSPRYEALTSVELEQVRAFLRPRAHLREGKLLRHMGIRCAIDVSDGVLSEAEHLAVESGIDTWVDLDLVPFFDSVRPRPLEAAGAGEDFVLVFGAPAELDLAGEGFTMIGHASEGSGKLHVTRGGREIRVTDPGYEHLGRQSGATGASWS